MTNSEQSARPTLRRDPSSPLPPKDHGADPDHAPFDVICAGMYRACSTWQYTVAAHLVEQHRGGKRLGYLSGAEYASRRPARVTGALKGPMARSANGGTTSGWTVFKSHDGDRFFARALRERRALVLYAYRDVRDVVFSLMHKRGQTFEHLLRQGMIQQILWNDRFWTRSDGVLVQKYEDLIAEPTNGVIEIARHLGISIEPDEAARIASEYSAESNRARIESLQKTLRESGVDLNDSSNQQICDPATLLHWNHLRPPRTETWRELATPSQRRMLERYFGNWLESRGYVRDDLKFEKGSESARSGLGSMIGGELDVIRGWASCRLHSATLNYPEAARFAKRIIGHGDAEKVGAFAWQDPGIEHTGSTSFRGNSKTHQS